MILKFKAMKNLINVKMLCCVIIATSLSVIANAKEFNNNFLGCVSVTNNTPHKINGYKYLCMEEQGNKFDLEDKFNAFFQSIGFVILTQDELENLNENEKQYVLYGSYETDVTANDDGTMTYLTFTLKNNSKRIIFSTTKSGWALLNAKKGFKKASNKVIKEIQELNYSFNPKS